MKYRIQVHIHNEDKKGWFFIKGPSGKEYKPYEYDNENEAYRMAKMCYPNSNTRVTDTKGVPIYPSSVFVDGEWYCSRTTE